MGGQRYAYCHACALEAAGDAAGAAEAFGKLGDFEDAALHQYYNKGVDAENRKDYEKALYDYSAAGNVADASDRLLNLQGQIYNRAIELREEHSYEEAIYLFTILGDYLSSARQAVECEQIFRDAAVQSGGRNGNGRRPAGGLRSFFHADRVPGRGPAGF